MIMKEIKFKNKSGVFFALFLAQVICMTCSCDLKIKHELRFAVIGDLHYSIQESVTSEYIIPAFSDELHKLKTLPEFIIQTGDFIHGGRGKDIESEAAFAFSNFSEIINIPFYLSRGNHDRHPAFKEHALKLFSTQSGKSITRLYYSFNKANCHFIFLDCEEEDLTEQMIWLEEDLKKATSDPDIDHIFAAGHYPLWIVARAGFTRPDYAENVASLLARYKTDAYFCGHTHNKTISVRLIEGQPVTQIMDAAAVEEDRLFNLAPFLRHIRNEPGDKRDPGILALEECHQIFIPENELIFYRGYQEGSSASYNVITVKNKEVRVDWHVAGKGVLLSYKWNSPGQIVEITPEITHEKSPVTKDDLLHIEKAWYYAAPWTSEDSISVPLMINGADAGTLDLTRARMAYSPFWNKIEIPLNRSSMNVIRNENEISVLNPSKSKFGLAHMFLLVQLKDGRFAKSNISQKVLTSFIPGEAMNNFPAAELIDAVNTGQDLSTVKLKFEYFYNE